MTLGAIGFLLAVGGIGFVVLGAPLSLIILLVGSLGYISVVGLDPLLSFLSTSLYWKLSNYELAVIPLFLFFSELMARSGLARSIFVICERFAPRVGAGFYSAVGASAALGTLGASSLATTMAVSRIARPTLRRQGYPAELINAVIGASGTLGVLIPPSLILVVYSALVEASLIDLFAAAIIPAVMAVISNLAVVTWLLRRTPHPHSAPSQDLPPLAPHVLRASFFCLLIVLVLGGMFLGWFTPNQSAAVGVALGLMACLIMGRLTRRDILKMAMSVGRLTISIYLILFAAEVFNSYLALSGLIQPLIEGLNQLPVDPLVILGLFLLIVLIGGCVMDSLSLMILLVPILFPVLLSLDFGLGLDGDQQKIWLGMIVLIVVEVGLITPPFGLNLLLLQQRGGGHLGKTFATVMPFIVIEVVRAILLIAWPSLTLVWI